MDTWTSRWANETGLSVGSSSGGRVILKARMLSVAGRSEVFLGHLTCSWMSEHVGELHSRTELFDRLPTPTEGRALGR